MNLISRRRLGLVAAATGLLPAAPAAAAEFTLKVGHEFLEDNPVNIQLKQAADRIADRSGGRVAVQLFPNNQLGGATDMLSQTRSGALEFTLLSSVIISSLVPVAAITGVGYAFPDYDHVWAAMDGKLGALIRGAIGKAGLRPMDRIWDLGFRNVANNERPVNSIADMSGLKIRVAVGGLFVSLFKGLGASPVTLNFSEVYTSLQTRIVDGTENPLQAILLFKLNEVLKYGSLTRHLWDGQWLIGNARGFAQLPEGMQALVTEEFNAAALRQRADNLRIDGGAREQLTAKGMVINDLDTTPFKSKLVEGGFYREWKSRFDPAAWSLLEEVVGAIG